VSLSAGDRLGPYEVLAPLGAGGMGEVYRARDERLGRDAAVKVLSGELGESRDLLARFEKEARSASSLNHPAIVTIYEIGESGGRRYIAMELVDGVTLRDLLGGDPLPLRKALPIAAQVAEGLAAAHAKGIVHRDLKPENLMVTREGGVKILDFGLAKLAAPTGGADETTISWEERRTRPGTVMGTVGYMSPEQAGGKPADFRADQFSFGTILYEMLSGRRAFQRGTAVETMSSIIRDEPEPIAALQPKLPVPLRWILERCLEKDPEERYGSTKDLARDLAKVRDQLSLATSAVEAGPPAAARRRRLWLALPTLALAAPLAFLALRRPAPRDSPEFHQLTFRRGAIPTARFAPDGETVLYTALWSGEPGELFSTRRESPESRSLGLKDAEILAVSPTGEMALSLRSRLVGVRTVGTLARAPLSGEAPRELLEDVQDADWTPRGDALAVVHLSQGRFQLELPAGKPIASAVPGGWLSHPRVSPDGRLVAYVDHVVAGDDRGAVTVVGTDGQGKRVLTPVFTSAFGLAWSPGGQEVWFTAAENGYNTSLRAVTLSGAARTICRAPGRLVLHDISRDGRRVVVARDDVRTLVVGHVPGETQEERDLSTFDSPFVRDVSRDGKTFLLDEEGEAGGPTGAVYLRRADASGAAVRLGDGIAVSLSPDGRWVLARQRHTTPPRLVLMPTGPGDLVPLAGGAVTFRETGSWFPDSRRLLLIGNEPGKPARSYVMDVSAGTMTPLTPEGLVARLPSPDGTAVLARERDGRYSRYALPGGERQPLNGLQPGDAPQQWSADGRALYVRSRDVVPRLYRLDLATGARELWKELMPADRTGVVAVYTSVVSPGGDGWAYTYVRVLSTLFLIEGLS